MKKFLIVGDTHATPNELEECNRLIDWIVELQSQYNFDGVVFLGDQYHSFANINAYVMDFWTKSFEKLKSVYPEVIALVGNHDQPGDNTDEILIHAMLLHKSVITVVDKPMILNHMLFMPYYHKEETWLKHYNSTNHTEFHTVIAHQTFLGATYENGFYAKDGFDTAKIYHPIISGHIHTKQSPDPQLTYPGSPRWRNVNDSNVNKLLHVIEVDTEKTIFRASVEKNGVSTFLNTNQNGVCSKMIKYVFEEPQDPDQMAFKTGNSIDRITVDLKGSQSYIKAALPKVKWASRIRVFPTATKVFKVSEQSNVHDSLKEFLNTAEVPNGTHPNCLLNNVIERLGNGS